MELRVLRYFLAAADEGSVTWAAVAMGVSQPTLSRQLKQLEEELGVTLFTRGRYSIELTREGRMLRERARGIVDLADKAEREIRRAADGELGGEVSVSCGESRGVEWLASRMAAFRARYPRVRFRMVSATADVIQERLDQGLDDMVLMTEPVGTERFESQPLPIHDQWGVMMRDDDPLAKVETVGSSDLNGRDLILPLRPQVRARLADWLGVGRDGLDPSCIYNLPLNAAFAVRQGLGVALCYDVGQVGPGLRFVPLSPRLEGTSVVAWKRNRTLGQAAGAFLESIRADLCAAADGDAGSGAGDGHDAPDAP